ARPERFLQMCSGNNMFFCNLTTPANFFHMLRRQLVMPFRMPAVLMSPKSLFRHPLVMSPISDLTEGGFQEVIGDTEVKAKDVKKLILCTGKIYFDLLDERQKSNRKDVALVRVEQLHPFPRKKILAEINKYKGAKLVWAQEEPENMGAWTFLLRMFPEVRMELVSRKAAASPATGYYKLHNKEQEEIVQKAFA
ncbi:MAG: 2-oxoglutarate dehydrogenase E1 component, partial [Imperialibacter sp.]